MTRSPALLCIASLLLATACSGEASGGAPPQDPQPAATQATGTAALTAESSVDELLDALDAAGRDLKSFQATVLLTDISQITGDATSRPGEVLLARDGDDVKFRAKFRGVIVETPDGRPGLREERVEYVLRDGELIDRKYSTRVETRRKLPPEEGKRDLLKLGEGPFPLPIGQKRDDVYAQFEVAETKPAADDMPEMAAAEGTRRLRLTPKAGTPLADDFQWLEIDVGLSDGMPTKVITLNRAGTETRVTELRNPVRDGPIPADAFELEPIDRSQWNVIVEDLSQPRSTGAQ